MLPSIKGPSAPVALGSHASAARSIKFLVDRRVRCHHQQQPPSGTNPVRRASYPIVEGGSTGCGRETRQLVAADTRFGCQTPSEIAVI